MSLADCTPAPQVYLGLRAAISLILIQTQPGPLACLWAGCHHWNPLVQLASLLAPPTDP